MKTIYLLFNYLSRGYGKILILNQVMNHVRIVTTTFYHNFRKGTLISGYTKKENKICANSTRVESIFSVEECEESCWPSFSIFMFEKGSIWTMGPRRIYSCYCANPTESEKEFKCGELNDNNDWDLYILNWFWLRFIYSNQRLNYINEDCKNK